MQRSTRRGYIMIEDKNLTVSYELLYLLQWLLENEPERLKKIIKHSLHNGLSEEIKNASKENDTSPEEMQYSIIDFLVFLESLLHESLHEERLKKIVEKKMMPALDNIDGQECDQETVDVSVEKASLKFETHPQENPQEILFQELLKCWKPTKSTASH